jgi:hypothetical protein
MRKHFMAIAGLSVAGVLGAMPAHAEDGRLALGVTGGTLGLGPEIAWRFSEHFGLRANGGFFDASRNEELDEIEYDADLKLNSFGAMLDWHPFGGGFRVSAGARANNNEVDLEGAPTVNTEIGDTTYTPQQIGTLTGTVKSDSFAPTLTLGYGGKLAKGLTFTFELGVMMQGSPRIENLTSTGGTLSTNTAFLQQLALEEQRAEDDADDYKYWPILQIGLSYRF